MCEWVYKHGQTCGYDAFSLALSGVLLRMRRVHLFLAQVGHRIGAILDFITEADMYLDSCDESLWFFLHYREAPPGTWYLSIGCTGIHIYIYI